MPTFEQIQEEIASMLSIPDEELTDEQRIAMSTYLDELAAQESSKVDGFAQFCRLQKDAVSACAEEAKRLSSKAKTAENRLNYLKQRYVEIMMMRGLKKISGHVYTMSVRESSGVAITGLINAIPDKYKRIKTTVEPDKTAIRAALEGGQDVPGCSIGKTYNLQIR